MGSLKGHHQPLLSNCRFSRHLHPPPSQPCPDGAARSLRLDPDNFCGWCCVIGWTDTFACVPSLDDAIFN